MKIKTKINIKIIIKINKTKTINKNIFKTQNKNIYIQYTSKQPNIKIRKKYST